ncbi:MAG: T9SS type A sorting domain-containing protein [Bacteroidia bacterium]|nr:T9SS type A sorting domain-containing protein [Bacteroidia bacterium]
MKKLNFIFICTLMLLCLSARTQNVTFQLLDTNNISARVNSDGSLFSSESGAATGFIVPKGSSKNTIFESNIWISGNNNADSQLHLAAKSSADNSTDFFYGPVANNYNDSSYLAKYNNVWKVNKSDIDYHITNYTNTGYTVPASIANWPGNGNTANGEMAILAPFFDANSNNIYDPENGDYPLIRGDQAIFFMFNDDKDVHGSGGTKLGIEVHGLAYSFADPLDTALNQTVFVNYKIINRSANDYHDVNIGAFTDMDIGNAFDDYIGCDSLLNMFYTYNGKDLDGTGQLYAYGAHPPAQGAVFLNQAISGFISFSNNSSVCGNPVTATDYYNYMNSRWKDSTQLTYGNFGYNDTLPGSPANFMYNGYPELSSGWNEFTDNHPSGDRRGLMTTGPFTFNAGGLICVDLAFPFARDLLDTMATNITQVGLLRQRTQAVQTFYNIQGYTCQLQSIGIPEHPAQENYKVFPNPNNGQFFVSVPAHSSNSEIEIYSVLGEMIYSRQISSDITTINLRNCNGMYLYLIKEKDKIAAKGKLVIE